MHLRELIFQGVLGEKKPRRLRPEGALSRVSLPAGVSVEQIHDLLIACLYPMYLGEEEHRRLQFSRDAKIAAVMKSSHGVFRVIRRDDAPSVRLQRKKKDGYQDVASGATSVQSTLREKLDFPRLEAFFPLHLWRFDSSVLPSLAAGAEFGDDPRIPEVVEEYLTAIEVESIEDEIKELEVQITDGKEALGEGSKIADKLSRAQEKLKEIAVEEMSDQEIELLQNKDEQLEEFRAKLGRLRTQEDTELEQINRLIPDSPKRVPRFWIGVAIALLALVASFVFHETHRIVALAAVPGFALGGFELLHYFNNMGRASLHKVRLESIRRRISQVQEEQILFAERIDHLLLHAGVDDETELQQRLSKAEKLRRIIGKLEEKLESVQRNPEFRRAREEIDSLELRLKELRSRREELPSFVMNSFQLEDDLKTLGVDPVDVRDHAESQQGEDTDEYDFSSPFEWLQQVAEWTGQWNDTGLENSARSMWSKICGHVLSERFDEVDLTEQGELQVASLTDEQRGLWQSTRTSEVHVVVVALALALHVNWCRTKNGPAFSSLWVDEPVNSMTPSHVEKFESVFRSAAKNTQIVFCQTGS